MLAMVNMQLMSRVELLSSSVRVPKLASQARHASCGCAVTTFTNKGLRGYKSFHRHWTDVTSVNEQMLQWICVLTEHGHQMPLPSQVKERLLLCTATTAGQYGDKDPSFDVR